MSVYKLNCLTEEMFSAFFCIFIVIIIFMPSLFIICIASQFKENNFECFHNGRNVLW